MMRMRGALLALAIAGLTSAAHAAAISREGMVKRCRIAWQPVCVRYGVPQPDPAEPPPRSPAPPPVLAPRRPAVPPDVQEAARLLDNGPDTPTFTSDRTPVLRGFFRQDWPGSIDYQAPPGAEVRIEIDLAYGGGHATVRLPTSPDGRRIVHRFRLAVPGSPGDEVAIARYEVRARVLPDNATKWVDGPVLVFGFGAGPRAVGSVAINDIRFAPTVLQRPSGGDRAVLQFSYLLENPFDWVSEDLWRSCGGLFCNLSHPRRPQRALEAGRHVWDWTVDKRAKLGEYHLVVRAWQHCGAPDPAQYRQCGNETAWVVGSAGPVFIQQ